MRQLSEQSRRSERAARLMLLDWMVAHNELTPIEEWERRCRASQERADARRAAPSRRRWLRWVGFTLAAAFLLAHLALGAWAIT